MDISDHLLCISSENNVQFDEEFCEYVCKMSWVWKGALWHGATKIEKQQKWQSKKKESLVIK
eukprot:3779752-Ditylum_brightwellii.AAC.1